MNQIKSFKRQQKKRVTFIQLNSLSTNGDANF